MIKPIILFIFKLQIFIPAFIIILSTIFEFYLSNIVNKIILKYNLLILNKYYPLITKLLIITLLSIVILLLTKLLLNIIIKKDTISTISISDVECISSEMFVDVYGFMLLAMEAINIDKDKIFDKLPFYIFIIYFFYKIINNSCYPNYIFKMLGYNIYKVTTKRNSKRILVSKASYSYGNTKKYNLRVIELDGYTLIEL